MARKRTRTDPRLIDRTGDTKVMKTGLTVKIIGYRNNDDIDVLFIDYGIVLKNQQHIQFLKGSFRCPLVIVDKGNYIEVSNVNLTPIHTWKMDKDDVHLLNNKYWHINKRGYVCGDQETINGKKIIRKLHRIILNAKPHEQIDHINGIKSDNTRNNLRIATNRQNSINRPPNKNNKSGYKGVSWNNQHKKWCSALSIDKKFVHFQYHDCKHKAALAYNRAVNKHYGEFAWLNTIASDISYIYDTQIIESEMERI